MQEIHARTLGQQPITTALWAPEQLPDVLTAGSSFAYRGVGRRIRSLEELACTWPITVLAGMRPAGRICKAALVGQVCRSRHNGKVLSSRQYFSSCITIHTEFYTAQKNTRYRCSVCNAEQYLALNDGARRQKFCFRAKFSGD